MYRVRWAVAKNKKAITFLYILNEFKLRIAPPNIGIAPPNISIAPLLLNMDARETFFCIVQYFDLPPSPINRHHLCALFPFAVITFQSSGAIRNWVYTWKTERARRGEHSWKLNPNTQEPDLPQHDSLTVCVIAQEYSSATFVSFCFFFRREIFGAHFKMLLFQLFPFSKLRMSEITWL